jgi:predicted Zn-dependent protease
MSTSDPLGDPATQPPMGIARLVGAALEATRAGRFEQAMSMLRAQLRVPNMTAGQSAELRLTLARVLLDAGRPKAAVAELVQVLRVDAHRPDALLLLTEALLGCGERDRAQEMLLRAQQSGGDPQRVAYLKMRLAGQSPPPSTDTIPVLVSDDLPTPRVAMDLPVLFDDDPTVPWVETRDDDPRPRIPLDNAPTEPLGWSIGDPGRAGVAHARAAGLSWGGPEEDTATGAFQNISGQSIRAADAKVQRWRAREASAHKPSTIEVNLDDEDIALLDEVDGSLELLVLGPDAPAPAPDAHNLLFDEPEETTLQTSPPRPAPPITATARTRDPDQPRDTPTEHLNSAQMPTLRRAIPAEAEMIQAVTVEADPIPPPPPVVIAAPPRPRHHAPPPGSASHAPGSGANPPLQRPHVASSANLRAQLRNPTLDKKLSHISERRVAARVHTAQDIPAMELAEEPPASPSLVPLILGLTFFGLILILALFIWPTLYRQQLLQEFDEHTHRARAQARADNFQGYQRAAEHLQRALDSYGPAPRALGQWTEGYLSLLGIEDIEQRRLRARGALALHHATLEERFAASTSPSAADLIAALDQEQRPSPDLDAARVHLAIARGDAPAALDAAEAALTRWPRSAPLLTLHARAAWANGDTAAAAPLLEQAQHLDPAYVPALFETGRLLAAGRDKRARYFFDTVLQHYSTEHEDALIERALLLIRDDPPPKEARDRLEELIRDRGALLSQRHLARAWFALALYHQRQRGPQALADAEDALQRSRQIDPDAPEPLYELIELLAQQDRLQDARALLQQASQRFRPGPPQRRLDALLLLHAGRPQQALLTLGQPLPEDGDGHALLGDILAELDRWPQAAQAWSLALDKVSRGNLTVNHNLQLARAAQGQRAELDLLKHQAEKDNDAPSWWRYGRALMARQQPQDAVAPLKNADRLDPQGRFRHYLPPAADLCRALLRAQDWAAARDACQRATTMRPDYLPPRRDLAAALSALGQHNDALQHLEAAAQLDPADPDLPLDIIRARLHLRQLHTASQAIDRLLVSRKEDAALLSLQGLLAFHQRRFGRAQGYFDRVIAEDPNHDPQIALYAAWCRLYEQKPQDALPLLRPLLSHKQWAGPAHIAWADALRRQNDWQGAAQLAAKGLSLAQRANSDPWHLAAAWRVSAQALAQRYGYTHPRAAQPLQQAIRLNDPEALYLQARLGRERPSASLQLLRRAVEIDPWLCPAALELQRRDPNARSEHCAP